MVFHGDRAVRVEVKTTSKLNEWTLGNDPPADDQRKLWVFVYLPADAAETPEYFLATGREVHNIVLPRYRAYRRRFLQRYGRPYAAAGVETVKREELVDGGHLAAWNRLESVLGRKRRAKK